MVPAAILVYVGVGLRQLLTLTPAALEFDFRQFRQAAVDIGAGHDPYATYLACCASSQVTLLRGYIYPPLVAEVLRPLAWVSEAQAAVGWFVFLQACMVGAVVVTHRALGPLLSSSARSWLLCGALLFPPLLENLGFMQVGTPMILLLALAGASFLDPATTPRSGVWVALGAALRVSPALAGLALVRRERASLAAIAVAAATGIVLLVLMAFAGPVLVEYVRRVLPALAGGSAVFDNLAPAGVALRARLFLFGGDAPLLRLVGPAVSVAVVAATLLLSAGPASGPRRRGAVFAAWTAAIPLVSSITWTHHLATELVAFAFLAPAVKMLARAWWLAVIAWPTLWVHRVLQVALVAAGVHRATDIGGLGLVVMSAVPTVGAALLWLACLDVLRTRAPLEA